MRRRRLRSGDARRRRRRYGYLFANAIWRDGKSWLRSVAGDDLANTRIWAWRLSRASSPKSHRTCLFVGLHRAGDWTWSSSCSLRIGSATISAGCCWSAIDRWIGQRRPIVCACFGVGRTTICDAIRRAPDRLRDRRAIEGGTNCGSASGTEALIAQAAQSRQRVSNETGGGCELV